MRWKASSASAVSISGMEEFRNRGYARNAVAAVSERALTRGSRFCVLFAETGLERVYERLGYQPIRDHLIVELRSAS